MTAIQRLKICYLVPGHDLVASMGPTRNVLSLAAAMTEFAEVSVAFRKIVEGPIPPGIEAFEISPRSAGRRPDDSATSGMTLAEFCAYLIEVRNFCSVTLRETDIVLEKSWLLSGLASSRWLRPGQIGIPVENIVQDPCTAARGSLAKRARLELARFLTRRFMSTVPAIIAETPYLKSEITAHWRVPADRVTVAALGVDRQRFRPKDKAAARTALGMSSTALTLLYVGVLDWTHDLAPGLSAIAELGAQNLEFHIVGDGARRNDYESMSREHPWIFFHGKVPHDAVPNYIATADLCLAPYSAAAFASREVGYSSLKIPEYLSCGRPVVATPGERMKSLISHGENGFLVRNDLESWRSFLQSMPSRETLDLMGQRAALLPLTDWRSTAESYLETARSTAARLPHWQGPSF